MEYDNTNRGALFKNKLKKTDAHPHYRGECTIGDRKLAVSAWIKTSMKGEKYMSLAFQDWTDYKEKFGEHDSKEPDMKAADKFFDPDDGIPL